MAGGMYIEKWQFGPDNKNVFYDYCATHFLHTHADLLVCVYIYSHYLYLYVHIHRNYIDTAEVCVCASQTAAAAAAAILYTERPVDFVLLYRLKSHMHNDIICLYTYKL